MKQEIHKKAFSLEGAFLCNEKIRKMELLLACDIIK